MSLGKFRPVTDQLQSMVPLYPPQRIFVIGYPGSEKKIAAGCYTSQASCISLPDRFGGNMGFSSSMQAWENARKMNSYQDEQAQKCFPKNDLHLTLKPGFSGGPAIDLFGNLKGITITSGEDGSTFLSTENIISTFFTAEHVEGSPLTLKVPYTGYNESTKKEEPKEQIYYLKR